MAGSSRLRTPLSKARGLGAAHTGAHHWWVERMTSLALVPLTVWFLIGLMAHLGASHEDAAIWLSTPLNSLLLAALMLVTLVHTKMGLQVIIDDYVHTHRRKVALTIVKDACVYTLALMTLFAITKLHFIGIN